MNVKILLITLLLGWSFGVGVAQTDSTIIIRYDKEESANDAFIQLEQNKLDDLKVSRADSLLWEFEKQRRAEEEANWTPDLDPYFANYDPIPAKAVWYAALFPGGGQIYNRKYWKLPIIYGGYLGLIYGYRWNQKYYRTYANAYRDLMLNSPNASYRDFLPPNYDIESHRSYLEKAFKRKRNTYRNYRDYCLVGMIGVYLVSIVDAYVDASLYHFDVSTDLDANNRPTLMVGYRLDF